MNYVNKMPLTDTQMGIYLECAENESELQYNITFEYIFAGNTDAEKLRAAF